jgi:hypothetical protein
MNSKVAIAAGVVLVALALGGLLLRSAPAEPVTPPAKSPETAAPAEVDTVVLDAPSADAVIATLRERRRVGLAEPTAVGDPKTASPSPRWTFETLGPLEGEDAIAFHKKREVYLGVSVQRLQELVGASQTRGEPDLARFAQENEAVVFDRAILEDFERGSYVTVRPTDHAATTFLHGLGSPTTAVVQCNAMRHGESIFAFFIFTKAARPEIFEAKSNTAETQQYLSEEFCKRFNALAEPKRRELWTAWRQGPKHPAYQEAQSWFQSKVPLRLALHEPDGFVVVPPR